MGDIEEPRDTEVVDVSTATALAKAELDQLIVTARAFPRNITQFQKRCMNLVTLNPEVAEECIYALPRKDRDGEDITIEGPSARLAEIVWNSWGNCKAGARVIAEEAEFVIAQGVFIDLERNAQVSYEVRRRITNRKGNRFTADMIAVTANAACSIALRNAVFKGIPKALWNDAYEAARAIVSGQSDGTLVERRKRALDYCQKLHVTEERVLATLGVAGPADIGTAELLRLRGIITALKDGETTVDEAFPPVGAAAPAAPPSRGVEGLKTRLAGAANEAATGSAAAGPGTSPGTAAAPAQPVAGAAATEAQATLGITGAVKDRMSSGLREAAAEVRAAREAAAAPATVVHNDPAATGAWPTCAKCTKESIVVDNGVPLCPDHYVAANPPEAPAGKPAGA